MAAQLVKLGPADANPLQSFLARDPVENLYLLGLLEELGIAPAAGSSALFAFYGCLDGNQLRAAAFAGGDGLVVPAAGKPAELEILAEKLAGTVQLRSSVGARSSVDALLRHLCSGGPRFVRSHRLFSVSADGLGPFVTPALRLANQRDLPSLVPLAAGAVREALERDPMGEGADTFAARVLERVRAQRTYVLEVDGKLVTTIDIKARSPHGAELDGLYTAPEERLRGYATLALGQLSRHLLSALPRTTLRVDEASEGLLTAARRVGYANGQTEQLLIMS